MEGFRLLHNSNTAFWWAKYYNNVDYSKKFSSKLTLLSFLMLTAAAISGVLTWLFIGDMFATDPTLHYTVWTVTVFIIILVLSTVMSRMAAKPLIIVADSIVYAGHKTSDSPPESRSTLLATELVSSLTSQVYDLASMSTSTENVQQESAITTDQITPTTSSEQKIDQMKAVTPNVLDHIGSPIFGLDSDQNIKAINKKALEYLGIENKDVMGKPFFDVAHLSFGNEETFEAWLKSAQKNFVTGIRRWERVRVVDADEKPIKQFDLTADFTRQTNGEIETMIVFFDRTDKYNKDDEDVGFVALAVHELRTPLTIMRGYIEVFDDELAPSLNPEMLGFMQKMQASAQQLTAFVGNILNVARIEENQLTLTLQKHDWPEILHATISDLELRAKVRGKHIELNIAENLPPVAVDRISIHEVINNLVDNAIKYSGDTEKIVVTSTLNNEGFIETSVQDFGIGIPDSVVPDLFQKFYRSHRSKIQIGGTGLGLYLSKALISAHNGNIWVHTKEGQGSIFSFTVQSYDQAKTDNEGKDGITRGAHGWIKNHSFNRQ